MVQEQMPRTFPLGKRPGTDQLTSVGQDRGLFTTELWSSWLTNLRIFKMENGKVNTLYNLYLCGFPSLMHAIDESSSSSRVT